MRIKIYADQAQHYGHKSNIGLVSSFLPKQPSSIEGWTSLDPWRPAVLSGTKMLATNPLRPASHVAGPPWIGLVCPAHPADAPLDGDPGNLEVKSTHRILCCASLPYHSWTIVAMRQEILFCRNRQQPSGNIVSQKRWTRSASASGLVHGY